jgi:hypothetical protein
MSALNGVRQCVSLFTSDLLQGGLADGFLFELSKTRGMIENHNLLFAVWISKGA